MDDLRKDSIKRFLQRVGIRLLKSAYYKHSYDRENYPCVSEFSAPVIFDVGANIGQSAIWYSKSFPNANIYAFEPIPAVFEQLEKRMAGHGNIRALKLACGKSAGVIRVPVISDGFTQTAQVLSADFRALDGQEIAIVTVDEFCRTEHIQSIQILKTDTEGYDIDVLQGAVQMLSNGSVSYILSEVSIDEDDRQHTYLFDLKAFLDPLGYALCSFFDIHHKPNNGRLIYCNALFAGRAALAGERGG